MFKKLFALRKPNVKPDPNEDTSLATSEQNDAAYKATRYILRDRNLKHAVLAEAARKADPTSILMTGLIFSQDDEIFYPWMEIANIQYKRLGGTEAETEENDRIHDQAADFAHDLIVETVKHYSDPKNWR